MRNLRESVSTATGFSRPRPLAIVCQQPLPRDYFCLLALACAPPHSLPGKPGGPGKPGKLAARGIDEKNRPIFRKIRPNHWPALTLHNFSPRPTSQRC
jgi:hypothetical protein